MNNADDDSAEEFGALPRLLDRRVLWLVTAGLALMWGVIWLLFELFERRAGTDISPFLPVLAGVLLTLPLLPLIVSELQAKRIRVLLFSNRLVIQTLLRRREVPLSDIILVREGASGFAVETVEDSFRISSTVDGKERLLARLAQQIPVQPFGAAPPLRLPYKAYPAAQLEQVIPFGFLLYVLSQVWFTAMPFPRRVVFYEQGILLRTFFRRWYAPAEAVEAVQVEVFPSFMGRLGLQTVTIRWRGGRMRMLSPSPVVSVEGLTTLLAEQYLPR